MRGSEPGESEVLSTYEVTGGTIIRTFNLRGGTSLTHLTKTEMDYVSKTDESSPILGDWH